MVKLSAGTCANEDVYLSENLFSRTKKSGAGGIPTTPGLQEGQLGKVDDDLSGKRWFATGFDLIVDCCADQQSHLFGESP